jgi:hypothetical protein
MEAHREHVYQRLTSGLGLPHLAVSLYAAGLAALVAAAWLSAPPIVATMVALAIAGLYITSPRLVRAWPRVDTESGGVVP